MQIDTKKEIKSITMLRGIAALAVCLYHFTATTKSESIMYFASFGSYGVHLFFFISGFILPYSMSKSNYRIKNLGKFLLKRIIRLDPPYIVTIIGVILLSVVAQFSNFNNSDVIPLFTMNTLYHLLYLVNFFNGNWLNPVFWTLAIEFQFYVFLGFVFPLSYKMQARYFMLLLCLFSLLCFAFQIDSLLSEYFLLFLPGFILYFLYTEKISWKEYLVFATICLVINLFKIGFPAILLSVLPTLLILFYHKEHKIFMFLGKISYSLYLIHTPIGTDGLINFMQNYILSESGRVILMIACIPIIIFFAWAFYKLVEEPARTIAKKINYNS